MPDLAPGPATDDPRLVAAFDMIGRTGATGMGLRYQDDEQPIVWIAVGTWSGDRHEVGAALDPTRAALRLCEQVVDGGQCTHCSRPTGFEPDHLDSMPADQLVCWYQWDPELKTFRRSCEGDTAPRPNRAERRRRR
jgi:hypothetical protein